VAPASYNTICKWALGISDNYALGVLAETTGLVVPTSVLPFVNSALPGRLPFQHSVDALRAEGVHILIGSGGIQAHPPRTGDNLIETFPWRLALDEADHLIRSLTGAIIVNDFSDLPDVNERRGWRVK
jgi:hypothetical protein